LPPSLVILLGTLGPGSRDRMPLVWPGIPCNFFKFFHIFGSEGLHPLLKFLGGYLASWISS
jgi:hypothetical protein